MDRIERYYLRQSEGGFATPGFICNNRKCLENDPLFTNGGIITTPRKNNNNKKKASPPKGYKVRKAERLFQLVPLLKGRRLAITAKTLSDTLEVSERTIYRDIQALIQLVN